MHMSLSPEIAAKLESLVQQLAAIDSLMIAYSGGTDSAFLAWAAHQALGDQMLAVIADSPSLARFQLADAIAAVLTDPAAAAERGRAARARAERYSLQAVARQYADVYRDVSARGPVLRTSAL